MAVQYIYNLQGVGTPLTIGLGGHKIRSVASALEVRNNTNNNYASVRGADPVTDDDFVTLRYLRTSGAQITVVGQINGTAPSAPADGVIYIVTTSGGSFLANELYLRKNGMWEFIPHVEGMTVVVGTPLTGGTVSFSGDHLYLWDTQGASWIDVGPVAVTPEVGYVKSARSTVTVASGLTLNIGTSVPAGARVNRVVVDVTTAFNGTNASLAIGDIAVPNSLAAIEDTHLGNVMTYVINNYVGFSVDTQLVATFDSSGSTVGQAEIEVFYSLA